MFHLTHGVGWDGRLNIPELLDSFILTKMVMIMVRYVCIYMLCDVHKGNDNESTCWWGNMTLGTGPKAATRSKVMWED